MHSALTLIGGSDAKSSHRLNVLAVVRNELLRLPQFLNHYRTLGVRSFIFVDNASNDGTTEYLRSQEDCSLFYTEQPYSEARFGVDWQNALLDHLGEGCWNVLADADEMLVYDRYERRSLPQLCAWLSGQSVRGLQALMLDMYSDRPLDEIRYVSGTDFLETCPYFDADYSFVRRFAMPFTGRPFPRTEPVGGPRLRYCFPNQNTARVWPRVRVKMLHRLAKQLQRLSPGIELRAEAPAPQSFKIPLVLWRSGDRYFNSHRLNEIPLTDMTGVLLHFKYLQDFAARVQDAVERDAHHNNSAEYRRYAELLRTSERFTFIYEGTVRFDGSEDLVERRLMRTVDAWRANQPDAVATG